ncbi:MFS transporter [Lysinibacillus sphaericus]|uniref:Transporter n=3 Tax=Lysinibacillus TaxID=400634 RepID=A0A2S0JZR4_LYSSH|nr:MULTISPECIES: MFS transporter [Lysinibacillus]AHN22202.1 macrolide transporter [Lysinibacillus varians]AVK96558.1 MFS transporter [Lysinibacillus sphaericus]MED4542912.1 MFS transporter [Lysinibacillus sphaericus]TKI19801.1 MFS transporter [Lysinibacillus sphaericus]TKI50439.1 MFS transporter [Lysinibacillus tabacifolii]
MWGKRNVWIILLGEFVVGLGLWAGIIGNLAFMQKVVPSDFHKSLIISIGILAGLVVAPLAGRLIDQSKKKTVIQFASVGRILSVFFMFIALYTNSVIWMILFLITLQIAAAFYMPALQSIIPLVVKDKDLMTLNAWQMNARTISRIVGTAAAGLMLSYFELKWLYIVSLIVYIIMYFITNSLKLDEAVNVSVNDKEKGRFKDVYPMLKEHPVVLMTLVLMLIPTLFLGSFNLVIMKITEMHESTTISGLLYTVEGIGFMLGAAGLKYIAERVKIGTLLFGLALIIGLMELMLLLADSTFFALLTFGLFGFSVGCFFPTTMVIFQKQVPKEYHGRFFSFRNMIDSVVFQIVLLSTGMMLDLIGLSGMGIVFGMISLSLTVTFFLFSKKRKVILHAH